MKQTWKLMLLATSFVLCACAQTTSKELEPEPTKKTEAHLTMSITGDLLFEQGLYDSWNDYEFGSYFDQVKPYLKGDIVIGNQEVPIGGEALGVSGVAFTFNAPEKIATQLPSVGFDVMTLSNNHSYDMGYQGVVNTLQNLQNAGIQTVGLYATQAAQDTITVLDKHGIKVAFLAYTYDTNYAFEYDHPEITKTFLNEQHEFDEAHQAMIEKDVKKAKQMADVIVVSMHWGNEFTYELSPTQLAAAQFLNEQGVDLVIGNHSHCLQTMDTLVNEEGKETIVFYSLGNFVSAAANVDRASETFTNMYEIGGIVNLRITKNLTTQQSSIDRVVLTPIVNHFEGGYTNFALMPWNQYHEDLAAQHGQRVYSESFHCDWINEQIQSLFEGKVNII